MIKPIRHGEVMLYPVAQVPTGQTKQQASYIVGHSETGHHHVLEGQFEVTQTEKDELYVRLFEPGKLVHKKQVDAHKTLPVPAGAYRVIHKTEYDPWQQLIREVFD